MSKSFMSAIRGVVNAVSEGAKDKTADGMTKDAAHFRHDLHKVQDSGFKHMVQKDSETSDYAKMFNGDVDHAKPRLADQQAPEDLNKYVEYNEEAELEEAKKAEKHDEDCECEDCSSEEKEEVKEVYVNPNADTPAGRALNKAQQGNAGKRALPLQAGQKLTGFGDGGANSRGQVAKTTNTYKPPAKPASSGAPKMAPGTSLNRPSGNYNPAGGTGTAPVTAPKAPGSETAAAASSSTNPANRNIKYTGPDTPKPKAAPVSPAAREPASPAAKAPIPKPKPKPAAPQVAKAKPSAPKAAAPKTAAPQAPKTSALQRQMQRSRSGRDAAVTGPKRLNQSFEIDIQGTSYLVSESHAAAIAAFVEKHGMVNEMTAGEFISKEMKHPEKLTAKGKKQKIKQAIAIYYSKKRRGENP